LFLLSTCAVFLLRGVCIIMFLIERCCLVLRLVPLQLSGEPFSTHHRTKHILVYSTYQNKSHVYSSLCFITAVMTIVCINIPCYHHFLTNFNIFFKQRTKYPCFMILLTFSTYAPLLLDHQLYKF
jgi:hypothetical protein